MNTDITLKFNTGELKGKKITFSNHEIVTIGRDVDSCTLGIHRDVDSCTVVIPKSYQTVSQIHCTLKIDSPFVIVSDLNSKNGTWLNGDEIGGRAFDFSESEYKDEEIQSTNDFLMKPGDKLILGGFKKNKNGEGKIERCEIELEFINLNEYFKTENDFLGEGKMGVVKLVKDVNTKCLMAIKILKPNIEGVENNNKERILDWFLREFYNGRQINHGNVVKYYYLGLYDGRLATVMEYCPGGNLEKLIDRVDDNAEFDESLDKKIDLATQIIFQVFDAIDYIHRAAEAKVALADNRIYITNGMVHRDIRPDNILLMDDSLEKPVVKVIDLGFTKTYETSGKSDGTFRGEACGDWSYVPKQQVEGYLYAKPEVDVWATFATYYRMLVGIPPKGFIPDNEKKQVIERRATDILEYNSNLPIKLAFVINLGLIDDDDDLGIILKEALVAKKLIKHALNR